MSESLGLLRKVMAAAPMLAALYRTGSFTHAAAEMGQKQSAVSHKIRALEADVGYPIFIRTTRHVEATRKGRLLCEACLTSVDGLAQALEKISRSDVSGDTVLTAPSSLALKWLVPAMARARDLGLGIALEIDDDLSDIDAQSAAQVAVRFGTGPYPGLHVHLLSKCAVTAVASPLVRPFPHATAAHPAMVLRDVRSEEDGTGLSWDRYFQAGGLGDVPVSDGAVFHRTDIALQAAIGGMGHALGRSLLIESDLEVGLLVARGPSVEIKARYWLVTSYDYAQTQTYQKLSRWLMSEVKRSQAQGRGVHLP